MLVIVILPYGKHLSRVGNARPTCMADVLRLINHALRFVDHALRFKRDTSRFAHHVLSFVVNTSRFKHRVLRFVSDASGFVNHALRFINDVLRFVCHALRFVDDGQGFNDECSSFMLDSYTFRSNPYNTQNLDGGWAWVSGGFGCPVFDCFEQGAQLLGDRFHTRCFLRSSFHVVIHSEATAHSFATHCH